MRASRSIASERGAVAVIFAIMVPLLLLPIGAIVVDIGFWYRNAKHAQTTADAAALAASFEIPDTAAVRSLGGQFVTSNMSDVSTEDCVSAPSRSYCVEYPYVPNSGPNKDVPQLDEVEVVVRHPAPAFFGRIFGVFGVGSERRAVAEQWKVPGTMAIYVNSEKCAPGESLEFDGSDMHITGWVHTQGGLKVSVSGSLPQPNFTASEGTMREAPPGSGTRACSYDIQPFPKAADFSPESVTDWLPEPGPAINWPVWYTPAQFGWYQPSIHAASPNRCRYKGNKIEIDDSAIKVDGATISPVPPSGLLPTGIYCARETFSLGGSKRFNGSITALAEEIKINPSANGIDLDGYAGIPDKVIFFTIPNSTGWPLGPSGMNDEGPPPGLVTCSHTKELQFNGNNSQWTGLVFNPCTRTLINQSNTDGSGAIVTKMLKVNGSDFDFTGNNNFSAELEVGLVE
jgi:hypothetical protein